MAGYSPRPGGPIWRAAKMRLRGDSYDRIARALRADLPDECGKLQAETVRRWAHGAQLSWNALAELHRELVADTGPTGATPHEAERLEQVRLVLGRCIATLRGEGEHPFTAEDLKESKIRPDTLLTKLLAEERQLTRSDLLGIPRRAIQRVVLLVLGQLVKAQVARGLLSEDRMKGAANQVAEDVVAQMPTVLHRAAAEEAVTGQEQSGD